MTLWSGHHPRASEREIGRSRERDIERVPWIFLAPELVPWSFERPRPLNSSGANRIFVTLGAVDSEMDILLEFHKLERLEPLRSSDLLLWNLSLEGPLEGAIFRAGTSTQKPQGCESSLDVSLFWDLSLARQKILSWERGTCPSSGTFRLLGGI